MKTRINVTNQEIYNESVGEVDISMLRISNGIAKGTITIELVNGEQKNITGEFDPKDYVNEYGFEIVPND